MKTCIDLTGEVYGKLTVLTRLNKPGAYWLCRCSCGKEIVTRRKYLRSGDKQSCGCVRSDNLVGQTFGRLVVLRKSLRPTTPSSGFYWWCKCECGKEAECRGADLKIGKINSCGCLRSEMVRDRRTTHGESNNLGPRAKEYRAWKAMKVRCTYASQQCWKNYGGRVLEDKPCPVTIAPEWLHNFDAFYAHIGPSPSSRHTVDRIDPFGSYVPGNVRWATYKQQRANQRQKKAQLQLAV